MSGLSSSPRLLKGALVTFNLPVPVPQVIAFQYNPETLARTLEAQTTGGGEGAPAEAMRIKGAPVESIKLDIEIDATDGLELGEETTVAAGIHPTLAALELLIYPSSAGVIANTLLLGLGTLEIQPPEAPFTLFVWGPRRVLPVRLKEFSVAEEAYDPRLNPIRAKVSLGLRVLSYNDLPRDHPGYYLFLAHQISKEVMASSARSEALNDILEGDVRLL